jgi:hypothetical protein
MAEYDIVHIAIASPNMVEASLIEKVAAIVNKDLYETRLLLAGKIPRTVAHYQTIQAAESVAQSLRALGIVAIAYNDSELRKPSLLNFRAHTLKLEGGEVTFWNKGGEARRVKAENVFLILKGKVQTYTEKETTRTKMKFSLPATVLTGGIPIWRKVKETTRGTSSQTEYFVRLYDQTSPEPTVEIFQYNIDYSFLGKKMASSSLINLNTTVTELRNTFPQAVFDDRLAKAFQVDVPSGMPVDETEVNCKLIYLYHQALSSLGPSA